VPDFLEDLVAYDLLDASSRRVIGMEALSEKALERRMPMLEVVVRVCVAMVIT
jgi:hypothetical protein